MIYGIGIDIVSIKRIDDLYRKYGHRFLRKIFSPNEISQGQAVKNPGQYFAARFAAREAFFKAVGTGWGRGISLREVSVVNTETGQPRLSFSDRVRRELQTRKVTDIHISITHEGDIAQAIVILEGG